MPELVVRHLGVTDYEPCWRAMQRFTAERSAATADEVWLCQHLP
ncbi:MAG: octanoyltransferase, partial [Proteobacteria bacterium]|nr:octanoyltransferase [Pseudomonadota bacterium]